MNKSLIPILELTGSTKRVLILISLIAIFSAIDSQLIRLSYGSSIGRPDNFHLLLFTGLTIAVSSINTILLLSIKSSDILVAGNRILPLKSIYLGISISQYAISFVLFLMILQMALFSQYNKTFSLIIVLLSHISSTVLLGIISFVFMQH